MTQKRGLGRGLGALIPGAGSAPAPEQELRTRAATRARSEEAEQSASERPVDMFFSGEELSEEERQLRDRGPRQDLAGDMARDAAKRRGRGASTHSNTGRSTTAGTASDPDDAETSKQPRAASSAKKTPAKTAATKTTATKTAAAKTTGSKGTGTKTAPKGTAAKDTAAKGAAAAGTQSTSAKGAAKKNVAGPGGAAEDTPAQETAPTSGAGAAKGTGSRSTTAEKGTSAKGSATTNGSTSRSSSASRSAAPGTRTIDDGTGPPEGSTVEQNPVVDVEQVDPTPTQEPGAAPGAGDSEPRADAGASERVDDSNVDSGVTELREVTTESEAPARQESGEGETAAGSRDDAAETETAPEAATASDEAVDESTDDADASPSDGLMAVPGAEFAEIPIHEIRENPRNPRTMFHEDELDELASSVRQVGVLQPVVVRPIPVTEDGESFELVMGERRWRAARRAELESIPSIIRETSDDALLRDALLENLHRTQLNPLEEAAAYQQLLDDFGCTQDELGERIGRSRPQITNTLRLLRLPALVQRRLASGALGAGHARALLGLDDPALMEELAQRIVSEGLSVRAVERLVAGGGQPSTSRTPRRSTYDPHVVDLTSRLSNRLETQVRIDVGKRKGRVTLEFTNLDDLERLMENIGLDLPSEQEQDSRD